MTEYPRIRFTHSPIPPVEPLTLEDISQALVRHLNPQQAEAVLHHGTPLLIVAGAGSGKTRVITHRIAHLILALGVPRWNILAVTFTNKAAREMRERLCALLGIHDDPSLAISTFHSRCVNILRREAETLSLDRNFAILDDRDQLSAIKRAMEELNVPEKKVKPAQVQSFINLAKMNMLTPEETKEERNSDRIPYPELYEAYQRILEKNQALDFEDLIFRTVTLLQRHEQVRRRWQEKFRHILVDEFQDTNKSQFELVKLLVGGQNEICVVGDEDQSIYSWRGADVQNLLDFSKTYPTSKIVRLEQNYRSAGNVLKAAGAVIENNTMRIGKKLWTEKEDGEPIRGICGEDDREEAELVAAHIAKLVQNDGIPPEQVALFFRSHRLSRSHEDAIRKYRLPYQIIGGIRFYDRQEVKDVLSFLRLCLQPNNDLAFERMVNIPTRGVGEKTKQDILIYAQRHGYSLFHATREMVASNHFKGKAQAGLSAFVMMLLNWYEKAKTALPSEMLKQVLEDTKYKTEGVGDAESLDAQSRLDNLEELEQVIREFELNNADATLTNFLEDMALDSNKVTDKNIPSVSLMTIHNAKGLEFDYVFVVGMEDGIFPNSRTKESPSDFEEERRLFYVALTRARKRLYLSWAKRRMNQGFYQPQQPSPFLLELPEEVLTPEDQVRLGITNSYPKWKDYGGAVTPGFHKLTPRSPSTPRVNPRAQHYTERSFGQRIAGASSAPSSTFPQKNRLTKDLQVGDRVEHSIMGVGVVSEKGGRPGAERVYVEFEDGRSQEFVLKFANLKKLG
ncbi:MAG: UvrD-helicase domain-containing protein [Candidatus Sumerlaeia bacterium]|nr:UvrD-helicase domain-containing protein [Candidatus Sumerlaeia bacterium]